jgi:metal-dependent amidase/aminoacylase/carboxypeptidase family protein
MKLADIDMLKKLAHMHETYKNTIQQLNAVNIHRISIEFSIEYDCNTQHPLKLTMNDPILAAKIRKAIEEAHAEVIAKLAVLGVEDAKPYGSH